MKHSHDKPFDPRCLHCLVGFTIEEWAKKNAPRDTNGRIYLDAELAITALAKVMGEIVYRAGDEATRQEFERFAHAALERAFQAESTGDVIVISFDRKDAA